MQDISRDDNDDAPMQKQSYSIATCLTIQKDLQTCMVDENLFEITNFIKFILSVIEIIDVLEPHSKLFLIQIQINIGAMNKEIESLQRN